MRQLRRMIRDEHFEHDPDQPEPTQSTSPAGISPSWDEHGRLRLSGSLDAEQGLLVDAALNEARDALFRSGVENVSWGDAMSEMARRSLADVGDDRRHRFLPSVHLHCDTGAAQLTNGVPLPPSIRDYLLCDSTMRPVWERDNVPFGVGRSQRTIPDRTRRVVEHRDQGCRVPACGSRHVEIHHIVPWSEGGLTDTANLISLCRHHHKSIHLGLLKISGDADTGSPVYTDSHDRELIAHPNPVVPADPPPPPAARYNHPSGERLQTQWVGLGWAHPNALLARRRQLDQHHRLTPRT